MDRYKPKTCPTCSKVHRKQGVFCSRSCGNHRTHTYKSRKNISEKITQHWQTEASEVQREKLPANAKLQLKKIHNRHDADIQAMTLDDFMLEPVMPKLPSNQFVDSGDIWTEE